MTISTPARTVSPNLSYIVDIQMIGHWKIDEENVLYGPQFAFD